MRESNLLKAVKNLNQFIIQGFCIDRIQNKRTHWTIRWAMKREKMLVVLLNNILQPSSSLGLNSLSTTMKKTLGDKRRLILVL